MCKRAHAEAELSWISAIFRITFFLLQPFQLVKVELMMALNLKRWNFQ